MSEQDATQPGPTTPDVGPTPPDIPVTYPVDTQPAPVGYGQAPYAPYPQPVYGGGYAAGGYAFAPAPTTNALAVTSLVLGIVGLVVIPFLGSIAAVITGHMGRAQIRERGEAGDGMAVGGLVMGYLGAAFWLIIGLVMLLPAVFLVASSTSVS